MNCPVCGSPSQIKKGNLFCPICQIVIGPAAEDLNLSKHSDGKKTVHKFFKEESVTS